jgi:hypothetical protein
LYIKGECERIRSKCELEKTEYKLTEVLPKVLEEYNNTIHHTIKMTPVDARKRENENKLQELYRAKFEKYKPNEGRPFQIGDKVRISVYKNIFTKGYKHNWSKEIFTISQIHQTVPITYSVKDESGEEITGKFYAQELIPTSFT